MWSMACIAKFRHDSTMGRQPAKAAPNTDPGKPVFGDGRVDDRFRTEFVQQLLARFYKGTWYRRPSSPMRNTSRPRAHLFAMASRKGLAHGSVA